jgi:hypothetical protein
VADAADARRRAEEALSRVLANAAAIVRLSWSDGATPSDRANLERIKSAAADIAQDHKILRALLAAGPEAPPPPSDEVREAAERAAVDLGNVLYNIETAELSAAWTEANEIRERLDAALRSDGR